MPLPFILNAAHLPHVHSGPFTTLEPLNFEGVHNPISTKDPLVVVFVEARLVNGTAPGIADLMNRLERFNTDLRAQGYDSRFVKVAMRNQPGHRDGEGVLAIRKLLQETRTDHPTLAGAILVGSFPEAMLVRRWIWRKNDQTITINGTKHANVDILRIVPEIIARRSDLVLADLTGNWATIYQPGPTKLLSIQAIPDPGVAVDWPLDGGLLISSIYEVKEIECEDFFWIQDDNHQLIPGPTGSNRLILRTFRSLRHPEVSAAELALPNPLSRPDIFVSRINARNVAWSPDPTITGTTGETLLDAQGKPQEITAALPVLSGLFRRDAELERRLIVNYFDRNHRVRQGITTLSPEFRTAAINGFADNPDPTKFDTWGKQVSDYLEAASPLFRPPVICEQANVVDFVKWLKEPAILKGLLTHAQCNRTQWDTTAYSVADLEAQVGGRPWRWHFSFDATGFHYEPSFKDQAEWGDAHLYRTIWENGLLDAQHPAMIIHTGCHVNSPCNAETETYDTPLYAPGQEGEAFLFYLNASAVVARAKDINDRPEELPLTLSKTGACLGDGWKRYFDKDSNDAALAKFENATRSKDSYWWGILGDWTLRLAYPPTILKKFIPPELRIYPFELPWHALADDRTLVKIFDNGELAERSLRIIRHYGFNERHIVGGEREAWEYYLTDGALPSGPFEKEQSIKVDSETLRVAEADAGWTVSARRTPISIMALETDAWAVVEAIKTHRARHVCWVGEQRSPAMTYLRR